MFFVYYDLFYILIVIMLKVDVELVLINLEEIGDMKIFILFWIRLFYLLYLYGFLIVFVV